MDLIDKKILYFLSLNARASLKEIGKASRLSKEVVHHRIKNLEKKGIIQNYYAVINTYKIGRVFYRVYLKTNLITAAKEKEFFAYLENNPRVSWVVKTTGNMDLLYVVWAKNITEFNEVHSEINNLFGEFIAERNFSVMTNIYYLKSKFLLNKKEDSYFITGGELIDEKLSSLDLSLLKALTNNGRASLVSLAKELNSTTHIISKKIRYFEKEEIILGYNIKINNKALGFTQRKVFFYLSNKSSSSINKVKEFLISHPLTVYITIAIGKYDIECELMESNYEEFHHFIQELKVSFPGLINSYDSAVFYEETKTGQL